MSHYDAGEERSWWKLILTGLLAIAFGVGAVALPTNIMFGRILDVIFGKATPLSGGMTAVAALLALVALVAVDGLVHLFGASGTDKQWARIRGIAGVAVAVAAVFWPGRTIYVAVELIGVWAILIGVLELFVARTSSGTAKDRALLIVGAIAAMVIGVAMMIWVFAGAVVASAFVGVAAAARGLSLIVSGIHARTNQVEEPSHGIELPEHRE